MVREEILKGMKKYRIELEKPRECPFCESDDLFSGLSRRLGHWVYCRNCGGRGPYAESKSGAIRKWNGSIFFPRHSYFALTDSVL
jgi:DnaJ-class molecular chaperone